jgi:hypothetical protein
MRIVDGTAITRRDEKKKLTKDELGENNPVELEDFSKLPATKPPSPYKKKKNANKQDAEKQRRLKRLLYIRQILGSEKALAYYYNFQIQRVRVWFGSHQPPDEALIDLMEFAIASNAERACGFKEFVKKIRLLENIDVTEQEERHLTDRERTIKEIFVRYRENRIPLPQLYAEYGNDLVNAMKSFFNILD